MKYELRNKYLSKPRYDRYLSASDGNKIRAEKLYNGNIQLAQAMHPILTQFEVILRNSLNMKLSSYFLDEDWILNQKEGFMNDKTLDLSNYFLKTSIIKSESKLKRRNIPITSGKIISDQNFGFWIALFLRHHYAIVVRPLHIFIHKPKAEDRATIYTKLDEIRNFRNRINHCEPICFSGNKIDCSEVINIQKKIYDFIKWIDPEIIPFFESIDSIQYNINLIKQI